MCNLDLEWALMLLDCFGPHVFIFLVLPMFTLKYPTQKALNMRQLEIKAIKKFKERENQKKRQEDQDEGSS